MSVYMINGLQRTLIRVVKRKRRLLVEKSRNAAYQLGSAYARGSGWATQDFSKAVKWFSPAAELGHIGAQQSLGVFYMNGWFEPPPNDVELEYALANPNPWLDLDDSVGSLAFLENNYGQVLDKWRALAAQNPDYTWRDLEGNEWWREYEKNGDLINKVGRARFNMGIIYHRGLGVTQDCAEAANWYRKAAELDISPARYNLGVMYATGNGVPQNYGEAVRLWEMAAKDGNMGALHNLGVVHARPESGLQDLVQAHKWFNQLATLSLARTASGWGNLFPDDDIKSRDAVAKQMTVRQVIEAQRLASYFDDDKWGVLVDDALSVPEVGDLWRLWNTNPSLEPPVQIDCTSAHMWLSLAVAGGDKTAARIREDLASKMTQSQIGEAERLARLWLERHYAGKSTINTDGYIDFSRCPEFESTNSATTEKWTARIEWTLKAVGFGAVTAGVIGAFFAVPHFFAVPETCGCRATVSPNLSDALIVNNSIADSRYITITAGRSELLGDRLEICYLEKPKQGRVNPPRMQDFLDRDKCNWKSGYEMHERREFGKTDIGVVIEYSVTEEPFEGRDRNDRSVVGGFYLNRSTNSCKFWMEDWIHDKQARRQEMEKKVLLGQVECAGNNFYFNPWSWFPQSTELFYTRAFYAIHKQRPVDGK